MTSPRRKKIKYRYWARKFPQKAYRREQILVARAIKTFEKVMEESSVAKAYLKAFEAASENPILIKIPDGLLRGQIDIGFRMSLSGLDDNQSDDME